LLLWRVDTPTLYREEPVNAIRLIVIFVLVDFVALNVWAFATAGAGGLVDWVMSAPNQWHYVAIVDLLVALSLCVGFMWHDARRRGVRPVVETALTLLGSVGPLLYLARRVGGDEEGGPAAAE
jgi:CHASE2 domain-containing sensor protein